MSESTRFVVQIKIEGGEWKDFRRTTRSRKSYTLTSEEAVAYMATLPETINVREGAAFVSKSAAYRVIKSVKADGLLTQSLTFN